MPSGAAAGADASQGARWHEQLRLSQDLLPLTRSLVSTQGLKPAGGACVRGGLQAYPSTRRGPEGCEERSPASLGKVCPPHWEPPFLELKMILILNEGTSLRSNWSFPFETKSTEGVRVPGWDGQAGEGVPSSVPAGPVVDWCCCDPVGSRSSFPCLPLRCSLGELLRVLLSCPCTVSTHSFSVRAVVQVPCVELELADSLLSAGHAAIQRRISPPSRASAFPGRCSWKGRCWLGRRASCLSGS